ncbi:MAG: DnaD domain protein [Eubacteriales bacterium]
MNQFDYIMINDDLGITTVENVFINHYMPNSPGDYVKVYLLGLKYCQGNNLSSISNKVIAKSLNLLESDVKKAWDYWKLQGIIDIEIIESDNYRIKYFHIASLMLDGGKYKNTTAIIDKNQKNLRDMYKAIEFMFGRPLSSKELNTISSWMDDLLFSPEMIMLLVEYCYDINKKDFNYLNKVAVNWYDNKITTIEQATTYLKEYKNKWDTYYTIMNYLGFKRFPSKAEIGVMEKWLFEYKMNMDLIIEACKRTTSIDKPNFKYIDRILTQWYEKKYTKTTDIDNNNKRERKTENKGIYDYDLLEKRLEEKMWSENE